MNNNNNNNNNKSNDNSYFDEDEQDALMEQYGYRANSNEDHKQDDDSSVISVSSNRRTNAQTKSQAGKPVAVRQPVPSKETKPKAKMAAASALDTTSSSSSDKEVKTVKPFDNPFSGKSPTSVAINYILGPEAKAILRKKFAFLGVKLYLNDRIEHHHGFDAFCRSYMDQKIQLGLATKGEILDIGGHMPRSNSQRDVDGNPWHGRRHSMCPKIDARDDLRHTIWQHTLQQEGAEYPIPNSCFCKASLGRPANLIAALNRAENVCLGCCKAYPTVVSVDSWYYPGVLAECYERSRRDNSCVYIAGNDYHACLREGKMQGRTADSASKFSIRDGKVLSIVEGNPAAYYHDIPLTAPGSWQYLFENRGDGAHYLVFEVLDTIQNVDVPYRLMQATYLHVKHGKEPLDIPTFTVNDGVAVFSPRMDPLSQAVEVLVQEQNKTRLALEQGLRQVSEIADVVKKNGLHIVRKIKERHSDLFRTELERIEFIDGYVHLSMFDRDFLGMTKKRLVTYKAKPQDIMPLIGKLIAKVTPIEVMRVARTNMVKSLETEKDLSRVEELQDAVIIAMHYAGISAGTILSYLNESEVLQKVKATLAGAVKDFRNRFNWKVFLKVLLILMSVATVVSGVIAYKTSQSSNVNGLRGARQLEEVEVSTNMEGYGCFISLFFFVALFISCVCSVIRPRRN